MSKILNFFLYALVITQLSCSVEHNEKIYKDTVNSSFMNQAEKFFGDKVYGVKSFSSYNSNMVFYKMKESDFTIKNFFEKEGQILKGFNWSFQGVLDGSYVFCNGTEQFEIVPPKSLATINDVGGGLIGAQYKDEWNIVFYKPNNSTSNFCYKYHEVIGIE